MPGKALLLAKPLAARLYAVMTNQKAMRDLLSLWNQWISDPAKRAGTGFGPFKSIFVYLKDVRRWSPQDRLAEKALFSTLRIPVAAHLAVDGKEQLVRAVRRLGLPGMLKTRRLGYDGKGQFVLREPEHIDAAWDTIGAPGLIYEKFQDFSREISIVGARSAAGQTVFYPLSVNRHGAGILRYSIAPYANPGLERAARTYLKRVMGALAYVGVLTIEFFVVKGRLVANEMAPRVHNSGHWTIEGCVTSQFENHLRAICGLPLGGVGVREHVAMVNVIGREPDASAILAIPGAHLHSYGKQPRPGRKLGHVTLIAEDPDTLRERVLQVSDHLADS
jgi:5-(carboxyamino)imidazole ribonucleotide synthase